MYISIEKCKTSLILTEALLLGSSVSQIKRFTLYTYFTTTTTKCYEHNIFFLLFDVFE